MISRQEEEWEHQQALLEAYDKMVPGIVGNPFVPHWPLPMQAMFLSGHEEPKYKDRKGVFQALYGGAAGGGKSDALLIGAAQYVHVPNYAGVIFRRSYTDLALPGAIMDRAEEWWVPAGARFDKANKIFHFPSGAKIAFAYLKGPGDERRYQGAEFQFTAWDELTQFPDARPYEYVGLSRVRRLAGSNVPLRTLAASNPGGPGHVWVMGEFVGGQDPISGAYLEPSHPYYPARINDNPFLDREEYIAGLKHLHPTVCAQLLEGDWRAREPGDYFRREWFGHELLDPAADLWPAQDCRRVRWWDLAASTAADACHTAGVKMARHRSGVYAVEHCLSFKATPGQRDDKIIQAALADGPGTVVGLEIEPGSGGIAQVNNLEDRLRPHGIRVEMARPKTEMNYREGRIIVRAPSSSNAKAARCDPVASCLHRGYQRRGEDRESRGPYWGLDEGRPVDQERDGIRLFAGPWTQPYLDVVEGFPGEEGQRVDEADATSGAWAYLTANPIGATVAYAPKSAAMAVDSDEYRNTNPSERPALRQNGRDRGGRWKPS